MTSDLEARLRSVGRALDAGTSPVSAAEAVDRCRDGHRGRHDPDRPIDLIGKPGGGHRRILVTTAAAALVLGTIGAFAFLGRSPAPSDPTDSGTDGPAPSAPVEPVATSPGATPPTSSPSSPPISSATAAAAEPEMLDATVVPATTGSARPDRFPIVRDPDVIDAWGGYAVDRGASVSAVIGRVAEDRLSDGVRVELFSGPSDLAPAGDPQVVEIDGVGVELYERDGSSTVVLGRDPAIAVTARDPVSFLRATGLGVVAVDPANRSGSFALDESVLPPGYDVVLEPGATPADALLARTATSLANSDGPSVEVSVTSPLGAFATLGDLVHTQVGGVAAWAAATPGGFTLVWPVSPHTWAAARMRGGSDETLDLAESVAFAAEIDFVDETAWRAHYRVTEPGFDDGRPVIAIDAGSDDGVRPGLLVESAGRPIGRVATVTASTSAVLPVFDPDFAVTAQVWNGDSRPSGPECRVRGGNDHVGYVCDRPFDGRERVGARIVAIGNAPDIADGTPLGRITAIVEIDDEPVALLDLGDTPIVAGDPVTIVRPSL